MSEEGYSRVAICPLIGDRIMVTPLSSSLNVWELIPAGR